MVPVSTDEAASAQELLDRIRVSEELYSRAFMSNPIAMSVTDGTTHRFTHINGAFAALAGYNRADIIGRTSEDLQFWPERGTRTHIGERIARGDDFPLVRAEIRRKDGVLVPILVSYRMLKLNGGESVLTVMVPLGE